MYYKPIINIDICDSNFEIVNNIFSNDFFYLFYFKNIDLLNLYLNKFDFIFEKNNNIGILFDRLNIGILDFDIIQNLNINKIIVYIKDCENDYFYNKYIYNYSKIIKLKLLFNCLKNRQLNSILTYSKNVLNKIKLIRGYICDFEIVDNIKNCNQIKKFINEFNYSDYVHMYFFNNIIRKINYINDKKYIIPKNFIYLKSYDNYLTFDIGNYKTTNNKNIITNICDSYYNCIIERNSCDKCEVYALCEKVSNKNICSLNKLVYKIYLNLVVNVSKNVTNER